MSETVKLIIGIPKPMYESVQNGTYCGTLYEELKNGVPLDSNSERAEVQAYFAGEAYGWEQGRKALIEDIKAEIGKQRDKVLYVAEGLDVALGILDNIGKGDTEE